MQGPYFTVSNLLSLVRVLLVIPIGFLLVENTPFSNGMAIGLSLLACLTDFLDGFLARKMNQVTDVGKILDPLADKSAIVIVSFLLIILRNFPWWLFAVILLRDLLIVVGGLFIIGKRKVILQSNYVGKVAVNVLAATVVVYMANLDLLKPWAIGFSLAAIIISSISYGITFVKQMKTGFHS